MLIDIIHMDILGAIFKLEVELKCILRKIAVFKRIDISSITIAGLIKNKTQPIRKCLN